jgi:ligand-binding sensor domain-containing protein
MVATAAGVYAGTLQHGLLCYDLARLRWRQVTDGLPSRNVTALAWANGSLYAGTDNGLVKIAEGVLQV